MKSIYKMFALLLTMCVMLGAVGCDKTGGEVDTTKPTIGIQEPGFNAEEMVAELMIIPSSDATAWFWKIEAAGENLDYQKVEGAGGAIISGKVEYGVEYTVSAYAVKGDIIGDTATKKFCFMPEEDADLAMSEVTLNTDSMLAECTIYPSKMTEQWGWRVYLKGEEASEWNMYEGNYETTIAFLYKYGDTYILEAYAEHVGGKSNIHATEVYFEPEAATISIGEPSFEDDSMTISFEVTPSESTTKWSWSINSDTPYESYEGNEPRTVSCMVEYDVEYTFTFNALNAVNKGETKSVTFKRDMPILEPLVEIDIKNMTAYTLDAVVTKAEHCVRYVAGAVHTEAYDRDEFIEQALSSLNPPTDYPFMVFNTATESRTFTEQDLVRNSTVDSSENAGIMLIPGVSYTIAVYGEDEKGRNDVYTTEVVIPEVEINGDVEVEIIIESIDETSATVSVTAEEGCKLLTGHMSYTSNDGELTYDFGTMTEEEICNYIANTTIGIPAIYTTPITHHYRNLALDSKYITYAIAIKDGKVGKVAIKEFATKSAVLTGTSKIIATEIKEQTSHSKLDITITADAHAKSVRLYAAPAADHNSNMNNLEYIMGSDSYQNYREEYTYTPNKPIDITVDIYHPGDKYYIYAVAVDSNGKAGEMVNVAQLSGLDTEYYQTIEEVIQSNITLGGTGEVALTAEVLVETEDQVDANITVEFLTDNIEKVWLYRINEGKTNDIKNSILKAYAKYPTITGAKQEVTDGATKKYQYMLPYTSAYGGTIIVAVVLDNDGLFNISSYYVAGEGVSEF